MSRPGLPLELRHILDNAVAHRALTDAGIVNGVVHDPADHPVHGADVTVMPSGLATRSALTGEFALLAPAGPALLHITTPGFLPVVIEAVEVPAAGEVTLDVVMQPRVPPPVPRRRYGLPGARASLR